MIEIIIWSFFVITWLSVGLHIIKEFIKHDVKKEDFVTTFPDKLEFILFIAFSEISFCLSFK